MRIAGGHLKNHKLSTPKGRLTRPTVEKLRQAVFNICQHDIQDAQFLDIFAGSGAMGIEALSRGAAHATFIENSRAALQAIRENLSRLDLVSQATVLPGDALTMLKKLSTSNPSFDLIYADPPYGQKIKGSHQSYLDTTLCFLDSSCLLKTTGTLFFEESTIPNVELVHLSLSKTRKVGNTHLFEYVR